MAFMGAAFVLAYRTAGSLVWVVLYEPTVRTLVLMGFIAYMMRTKTTTPVDPIDTPPEPPDPQERVRASNGVRPQNPHAAEANVHRGEDVDDAACCMLHCVWIGDCLTVVMRHRRRQTLTARRCCSGPAGPHARESAVQRRRVG